MCTECLGVKLIILFAHFARHRFLRTLHAFPSDYYKLLKTYTQLERCFRRFNSLSEYLKKKLTTASYNNFNFPVKRTKNITSNMKFPHPLSTVPKERDRALNFKKSFGSVVWTTPVDELLRFRIEKIGVSYTTCY